ncbi:hypothetical protein CsSME_00007359 [Camellia sinensis var. sinensis]
MATASLSLLRSSLSFTVTPEASSSSSSSSSPFFAGGSHLWTHKNFVSISSSSQLSKKLSAKRFGTVVSAAADYYSTLGVSRSASGKEIKAAYRSTTLMSTNNPEQQKSSRRSVLHMRCYQMTKSGLCMINMVKLGLKVQ